MSNHKGQMLEDEVVYHLNNKRFEALRPHYQYIIEQMFGFVPDDAVITCERTSLPIKPDVIIKVNDEQRNLSIKREGAETLHAEKIKPFILYLRSLGVSNRTQKTILLFQYGDGTVDGTGKERMDYSHISCFLEDRIIEAITELNNKELCIKILTRLIFDGVDPNAEKADAIYIGDGKSGACVTRRQIIKYLKKKNWNHWDSFHIGPIIIKPHARYANKPILNPEFRDRIDCYWPNLGSDLKYITKRYLAYTPKNKRKEPK